jgi:hypothetical protein
VTSPVEWRSRFRNAADREALLRAESGLPGPRGNLELLQVAADDAAESDLRRWAAIRPLEAPTNTPGEFIVACGVVGLGRLVVQGRLGADELRPHARDERWRVREAVAMALQRIGAADMDRLLGVVAGWMHGDRLEQRAVVAGLAEPVLLRDPRHARAVLSVLDGITATMVGATDRGEEPFRVLRQALGYAWSVAIAALPGEGTALLDRWCRSGDPDLRWIVRENLRKARLAKAAPAWTARRRSEFGLG